MVVFALARLGAINGDEIDYDDAYTLDYELIGLFVRQDRPADMSKYQGIFLQPTALYERTLFVLVSFTWTSNPSQDSCSFHSTGALTTSFIYLVSSYSLFDVA